MNIFNIIVLAIFFIVILLRILSNFNVFNYPLSIILPLVFIPLYLLYFLLILKKIDVRRFSKEGLILFSIVLGVSTTTLLQMIIFDNLADINGKQTFGFMTANTSLAVSWMLIGSMISNIDNIGRKFSYLIILIFISLYVLVSTSFSNGIFVDYYYLTSIRGDDIQIQHLSLTEPLTYIIFLFLAIGYERRIGWLFAAACLFLLFSLGGRTAFFSALLTILIYELITTSFVKFSLRVVVYITTILVIVSYISFENSFAFDKLLFKDGLSSDASYESRLEFIHDFFEGFFSQFAIGNPNFLIFKNNDLGTYVHNFLSVYQFYGIINFVLIAYAILYLLRKIYIYKIFVRANTLDIFGTLMLIYVLLSMLIGKSVTFGPFWFILGFWLIRIKIAKERFGY